MSDYPVVTLKSGREGSVRHRHPWVFSGALGRVPKGLSDGQPVAVAEASGRVLGVGSWSGKSQIAVRLFAFEDVALDEALVRARVEGALLRRRLLGLGPDTPDTGFRAIFGESDLLPGVVVDVYGDVLVLQLATAGADRLRDTLTGVLKDVFRPSAIVERSDLATRAEEGLSERAGVLMGPKDCDGAAPFIHNGMKFLAFTLSGQKTGFFLDQRDLRGRIAKLSEGRRVLNLFSYTGAHGVAALAGGAGSVLNVDSSAPALSMCREHAEMNGFSGGRMEVERADVFDFLSEKSEGKFDMVILDPPALIKSGRHRDAGLSAYRFLNGAALARLKPGGIFVTSSCSHFFSTDDFAHMLRQVSARAGRMLHPLGFSGQADDHPVPLHFPEASYLKSFVTLAE